MSRAPSVGKPPVAEKPPFSLSSSYRTIYIYEEPEPIYGVSREHPWTEEQFERHTGLDITIPTGAEIIGIETTKEGYQLTYQVPSKFGVDYDIRDVRGLAYEKPWLFKPSITEIAHVAYEHPEYFVKREQLSGIQLLARVAYEDPELAREMGKYFLHSESEAAYLRATEQTPEGMVLSGFEKLPSGEVQAYYEMKPLTEKELQVAQLQSMVPNWPLPLRELMTAKDIDIEAMQKDVSGRAEPVTLSDVLMITETAMLAYGATKAISYLPGRLGVLGKPSGYKYISWEDVGMSQQMYVMGEDVTGSMQFRVETFAKSHFLGKGMPTTPMSRTLELARGGLLSPAESVVIQEPLIQPKLETYLPSPFMRTYLQPKTVYPLFLGIFPFSLTETRQILKPTIDTKTIITPQAKSFLESRIIPISLAKQSQLLFQETQQAQVTRQTQQLTQVQRQLQQFQQIQKTMFKDDVFPRRRKRKRGEPSLGLFGRYKREYPILTGKQAFKKLFKWPP